jgi:hypothetical protein
MLKQPLGGATSWNVSGGAATFAPNLAAEIEPIENWLELEILGRRAEVRRLIGEFETSERVCGLKEIPDGSPYEPLSLIVTATYGD